MFLSLSALLAESSLAIGAALALAGAIGAFVYLPVVGRPLAAVLLAVSAGLGAYDLGYAARGRLDQSAALAAQLAEQQRQAEASRQIAQDAATREVEADKKTAELNERISDYERQLAARPAPPSLSIAAAANCPKLDYAACGCALSDDDVRGLRSIGAAGAPDAANAAGGMRPAGRGP